MNGILFGFVLLLWTGVFHDPLTERFDRDLFGNDE